MPPEPIEVFVGDLHVGGDTGLAPTDHCTNRDQRKLLKTWGECVSRIKAEARGKALILRLGGDLTEGHHHGSMQVWGTPREQRDAAVELLQPLANIAAEIYSVDGTAAHVGDSGDDDRDVAARLGARAAQPIFNTVTAGRRLNWAHHGVNVSRDPWLELNGMKQLAERIYWRRKRDGLPIPDLIVRHHAHISPDPITWRGIKVAICPCWQMITSHGNHKDPDRPPDIGVLAWWPKEHRLERWLYDAQSA